MLAGWLIVFFPVLACVLLFLLCVLVWLVCLRLIRLCRVVFAFVVCLLVATVVAAVAWLGVVSSVRRLRLLCAVRLSCCSVCVPGLSSFVCVCVAEVPLVRGRDWLSAFGADVCFACG